MRHKPRKKGNMEPILDIVIGTAGRFDMLDKCLNAVYQEAQSHSVHVILVDNGSPLQEKVLNQYMFTYSPNKDPNGNVLWDTLRLPENLGYPMSVNQGAVRGHAPLIMFLSDDVELQSGAIDRVLRDMDDPEIGVVGIKLLFPPNSVQPNRPAGKVQHVGLALNIRADPIHPLVGWPANHPKTTITRRDISAVTGACFTIRRTLYTNAGGFSSEYGKGTYEDVDMCFKVRQMGKKIMMDADALGYHYVGATMEKRNEPFALAQNNAVWKTKWMNSGLMQWDEWKWW